MRKCLLLPIVDHVGGAIGFEVFKDVESYLLESDWCYYRSNSEIMNILQNYKKNLYSYLQSKDVLKVLARKTDSGSLIKISIDGKIKGVEVEIVIYGANGEDIYFREKTNVENDEVAVIGNLVKNWLQVYKQVIPYDGEITGVLGQQFTINIGNMSDVRMGDKVFIIRPIMKRRHPLLKEIVEWKTRTVGVGEIFSVSKQMSSGRIQKYDSKGSPKLGDWIKIDYTNPRRMVPNDEKFSDDDKYKFGQLGLFGISLDLGKGETTTRKSSALRKIDGLYYGLTLDAELWATREWWGAIEVSKDIGSYSRQEGIVGQKSNTMNKNRFKVKIGYKYLPLGHFYGPQIDGHMGYGKYSFSLDTVASEGFGQSSFSGLSLGIRGKTPILKNFGVQAEMEFLLKPNYNEDETIYGESDSTQVYELSFGGFYYYNRQFTLDLLFHIISAKAKFKRTGEELSQKDIGLKFGIKYNF